MVVVWIILLVISGDISTLAQQSSIIGTYPSLLNSTIVTGYEGLQLTVQIQSGVYEAGCIWHYGEMFSIAAFTSIVKCFSQSNDDYILACNITNNVITSNLTILIPTSESVTVRVECQPDRLTSRTETQASLNLNVKDCSTISPLVFNSPSATYDSSGTFSCADDGTLFYSNETLLTSIQTTCLATAEWSGQNGLECWKAPSDVNIIGNLTVLEGHNISLTCSYTAGFPVMTNVSFNVNNEEIQAQKYIAATLNRSDHKKPVYCQANNRFTEIVADNSNDGRSPTYRFNVLYAPFQNTSNDCYLFSATDQDNIDCEVVFYSNPNATFVAVIDTSSGIELNSSREILIDGTSGKHTYKFTGFKITNVSGSIEYNLNVDIPQVPPFIHSIPFTVNIDIPKTTTATTPITIPGDGGDSTIIIVVVVVLAVVVIALVVLGIACWRRRQKHEFSSFSKKQTTGRAAESLANSNGQQKAMKKDESNYLSLDDPKESKATYEQIGGYENININPSTSKQQVDEVEYVNASTTHYINLNLEKTSFPPKPEGEYETMNLQVVTKE